MKPGAYRWIRAALLAAALLAAGCDSAYWRKSEDRAADEIIREKQKIALGRNEPFSIEPAADTLRRRLLEGQRLPVSGPASFGSDRVVKLPHWPEKKMPSFVLGADSGIVVPAADNEAVRLTLEQALMVAARNNRDYQTNKENVFQAALALDLQRDAFRNIFFGTLQTEYTEDLSGSSATGGVTSTGTGRVARTLQNGTSLAATVAVDVAKLLTGGRQSSLGLLADLSATVPLLAGSADYVVTGPLTQASHNVIYAVWSFERFKRTLAVQVAAQYLSVLQQLDQVKNAEDNYRGLITATRRARRLADAGRLSEVQVDQARQDELRARQSWVDADLGYDRALDSFRVTLGLPADANVVLDPAELQRLADTAKERLARNQKADDLQAAVESGKPLSADAPVTLVPATREGGGLYEIEMRAAVEIALSRRLDLRTKQWSVDDAQMQLITAADALRAGLNLTVGAGAGEGRSLGSAASPNAKLDFNHGIYTGGLELDLPFHRTPQAIAYRNAYIALESSVRDVQSLEDRVKLDVRNDLRGLLEAREGFRIQAQAVKLAERRVRSTQVFLEAGRAEMRDLLDAQDALVVAQNALTAALVGYRVAELNLQRDMDVLEVNEKGLWHEYQPPATDPARASGAGK